MKKFSDEELLIKYNKRRFLESLFVWILFPPLFLYVILLFSVFIFSQMEKYVLNDVIVTVFVIFLVAGMAVTLFCSHKRFNYQLEIFERRF